jgi:neocarzinostatin family protein
VVPLAVLAACGGSAPRARNTLPPIQSSSAPPTTSAPPSTLPAGTQHLTVTPHTGLKNGQTVHVVATGFSPNETLGVVECVDKGNATGEGDCDISRLKTVSSDARGRVDTTYTVMAGPFGSNRVSCSKKTPCLVSVSQQSLAPTEEANEDISFG